MQNCDIFFVKNNKKHPQVFNMRGKEIKEQLYILGLKSNLICMEDIKNIKKTKTKKIFVFVKPIPIDVKLYKFIKEELEGIVIIDCVDRCPYRILVDLYGNKKNNYVDGFIFANSEAEIKCTYKYPECHNKYDITIYHHASIPNKIIKSPDINFCFYGGKKYRIHGIEDIDNLIHGKYNFDYAATYNCHVSFRNYIYKPNTKISMAANCNSNIIINKNSGGVETLPEDYSYICGNSIEDLIDMIEYVKDDFGSENWKRNLKIMEWYKNEYSIENICKKYYKYFMDIIT